MSDVNMTMLPSLTDLKFTFDNTEDLTPPIDLAHFFCASKDTRLKQIELAFEQTVIRPERLNMTAMSPEGFSTALVFIGYI